MKFFNSKIIQKCFDDAQQGEEFYLYSNMWFGYYSTADYLFRENLKDQQKKFTYFSKNKLNTKIFQNT